MSRVQKIKFQWYFDFSTSADSMQIITVSAGGKNVVDRLKPFFGAYKRFRLGSVKCAFVPASTLPCDPTGLSYEAGENTVDPRDQLNPGLTRITNGEDFIDDISNFNPDQQKALYEAMVVDTRWYKWSLQSGLKRSAYPKFWQIGQLHQDYFPGATINTPALTANSGGVLQATDAQHSYWGSATSGNSTGGSAAYIEGNFSDPRGFFQTGHKGRLGWMTTDALIHYGDQNGLHDSPSINAVPTVELFKIITPKANKTKYYFRCYVSETVYFRDPITSMTYMGGVAGSSMLPMLDRFAGVELYNANVQLNMTGLKTSTVARNKPNDGEGGEDNHGSD